MVEEEPPLGLSSEEDDFKWPSEEALTLEMSDTAVKILEDDPYTVSVRAWKTHYLYFVFKGTYQKKHERADSLKQTLINLGLGNKEDVVKKGFLFNRKVLNQWEEEALVDGFKGSYFFFFAKYFFLQELVRDHNISIQQWKNEYRENFHQPESKAVDMKLTKHPYTLFGTTFRFKGSETVKTALFETINSFLDDKEDGGLYTHGWNEEMNRARSRIAKILISSGHRDLLKPFCLKQLSGTSSLKRKRDTDEAAVKKIKVEATISMASPVETPPPVEEKQEEVAVEIVEPEPEQVPNEAAPDVQRRNASVTLDVPEGMYRGRKILKEYKETWQARNLPVQIKRKTLVTLLLILTVVTYGGAVFSLDIPYDALIGITIGFVFLFVFLSTHFTRFEFLCAALILYLMWLSGNDSRLSQLGERDAFVYDWVLHRYHWVAYILCVIASRISKWLSFVVLVGAIILAAVFLNWTFVARFALFIPLWKCYREEVANPFTMIVVPHRDLFVFMFSIIACIRFWEM